MKRTNVKAPTVTDKQVGERVKARRRAMGKSQEDLATVLGLTFQQVQKYEKGTNRLSGGRMADVCRYLELTPNELLGFTNKDAKENAADTIVRQFLAQRGLPGVRLIENLEALHTKTFNALLEMVDAMNEHGPTIPPRKAADLSAGRKSGGATASAL